MYRPAFHGTLCKFDDRNIIWRSSCVREKHRIVDNICTENTRECAHQQRDFEKEREWKRNKTTKAKSPVHSCDPSAGGGDGTSPILAHAASRQKLGNMIILQLLVRKG